MLGTERYHDLVGPGEDAAPRQQPRLDLFDQQWIVLVDHVGGPVADLTHAKRHARTFPPLGGREQRGIELAVEEWIVIGEPITRFDDIDVFARAVGQPPIPVRTVRYRRALAHIRRLRQVGQGIRIDKVPAPLERNQESLIDELLISKNHGSARHTQPAGQRPA